MPEQNSESRAPIYPLMWANVVAGSVSGNALFINLQILIADMVHKDESNDVDVLSDTHSVILDIAALFKYLSTQKRFVFIQDISLTPFRDEGDDERTGWIANISIKQVFNYKECSVPLKVGASI